MKHHLAILALVLIACRDKANEAHPTPGVTSSASSTLPTTLDGGSPFAGLGLSNEPPPIELGPLPSSDPATREARQRAVLDLLAGGEPAVRLPRVATEPDRLIDQGMLARVAPPPPRPRLRVGELTVSQGLPEDVVSRVIRQNFGRIRFCYETALRANPAAAGTLALKFSIAKDGTTSRVQVDASRFPKDPAMSDCVQRVFGILSFPEPSVPRVEVSYVIHFSPS